MAEEGKKTDNQLLQEIAENTAKTKKNTESIKALILAAWIVAVIGFFLSLVAFGG